jgi:hypothetical protein
VNNMFHDLVLSLPMTDEVFDKLNTASNRASLRQNQHLTAHQFAALWEKNLPAAEAASMIDRPLEPEQIDMILAAERRGTVLYSLFRRNQLDRTQQETCVKSATGSTFPTVIMITGNVHPEILPMVAEKLEGVDRLEWCAAHLSMYNDTELEATIRKVCGARLHLRTMRAFNVVTAKIFSARPTLVPTFASSEDIPSPLLTTLASSRFLTQLEHQRALFSAVHDDTEFAALAFVANPVAHEEVVRSLAGHDSAKVRDAVARRLAETFTRVEQAYESVSDEATLNRLLRRCLPNQYRSAGRPSDLVALAFNPNLSASSAEKVFDTLNWCSSEVCTAEQLNAALKHLADRFGLVLGETKVETGFWIPSQVLRPSTPNSQPWALDPSQRPWSPEYIESASAAHQAETSQIAAMSLPHVTYASRSALHLYLVASLGTNPARWEMLVNLSSSHHGTLSRLVMATIKLAR